MEYIESKNFGDVDEGYEVAVISIDSLISRLNVLKTTMKKKNFVISKLTWDEIKIL